MTYLGSLNTTRYLDTVGTNYWLMPYPAESLAFSTFTGNIYYPESDYDFELWATKQVRVFNCLAYDPRFPIGEEILQTILLPMITGTDSVLCVINAAKCPRMYFDRYQKKPECSDAGISYMRMYRTHILRTFQQKYTWENIFWFTVAFLGYRNANLSRGFDASQS